jgi:hypothetical protein
LFSANSSLRNNRNLVIILCSYYKKSLKNERNTRRF